MGTYMMPMIKHKPNEGNTMAAPIDYTVTLTKPSEGRIDSERFYWYDYESPNALRVDVANYCNESVALGWNVEAFDNHGKIIFIFNNED